MRCQARVMGVSPTLQSTMLSRRDRRTREVRLGKRTTRRQEVPQQAEGARSQQALLRIARQRSLQRPKARPKGARPEERKVRRTPRAHLPERPPSPRSVVAKPKRQRWTSLVTSSQSGQRWTSLVTSSQSGRKGGRHGRRQVRCPRLCLLQNQNRRGVGLGMWMTLSRQRQISSATCNWIGVGVPRHGERRVRSHRPSRLAPQLQSLKPRSVEPSQNRRPPSRLWIARQSCRQRWTSSVTISLIGFLTTWVMAT
mmetsp:Transcript_56180/g.131537  ORF Transcript_56180/g.131537 Transcript_56180/m.131537 type:complete len:254 (+) Transcript_56180:555-1316(+)